MNAESASPQRTIILAVIIAWLPHLDWLPAEIIVLSGAICLYAWLSAKRWLPLPGKKSKAVLGLGLLVGLLYHFGGVERQTAIGLFCVMLSLKTLELATYRDQIIALLLTYLFTVTTFLFPVALLKALGCLLSLWVTSAALVRINAGQITSARCWALIVRMTLIALPAVVFLFIFFPAFYSIEFLKQPLLVHRRDPDTIILHLKDDLAIFQPIPDPHLASLLVEIDGVVHQIP